MHSTKKKQKYLYNQDISQFLITDCENTVPIRMKELKETNYYHQGNQLTSDYNEESFNEYKPRYLNHDNLFNSNIYKGNNNIIHSPAVMKLVTPKNGEIDINFPVTIENQNDLSRFSKLTGVARCIELEMNGLNQKIFLDNAISYSLKPKLKTTLSRTPAFRFGNKITLSPISVENKNLEVIAKTYKTEMSILQNEKQGNSIGIHPISSLKGQLNKINDQNANKIFGKEINLQLPCISANLKYDVNKKAKKIYLYKGKK